MNIRVNTHLIPQVLHSNSNKVTYQKQAHTFDRERGDGNAYTWNVQNFLCGKLWTVEVLLYRTCLQYNQNLPLCNPYIE